MKVNPWSWNVLVIESSYLGYTVHSYTQWLTYNDPTCNVPKGFVEKAWTPENQNTALPAIKHTRHPNHMQGDNTFLHLGNFLRVRNVSLLYDFKRNVLKNSKFFKGFIFGVNVENPFLFTAYAGGPDPESGWVGVNGSDWMAYPRPMTITANLKITF